MNFKICVLFFSISTGYYFFRSPETLGVPKSFNTGHILTVELLNFSVVNNNQIGDEWSFNSKLEDITIRKDEIYTIQLGGKNKIVIYSEAIENDPNHDDIGIEKLIITPDNLMEFVNQGTLISVVKVKEYHGPSAGKTATCKFIYKVKLDSIK